MTTTKIKFSQIKGAEVNVLDYGAIGDGTTNDAASINLALAQGGDVYFPSGLTYYLGTTALSVGVNNTRLKFGLGATLKGNIATPGNLPIAWISIVAAVTNVEVDGAAINYGSDPFSSYDVNHLGALVRIGAGCSKIKIKNCSTDYVMHSVYGALGEASISDIEITNNRFNSKDGDILLMGKSPTNILIADNNFPVQQYTPGYLAGGRIQIHANWSPGAPTTFTQNDYDSNYGKNIVISNNRMYKPGIRPVRLTNLVDLTITGNIIESIVGNYTGANNGVCDDLYTLNFIRGFTMTGNTSYGGGENGVDILSCQNGVISGNTFDMVDTAPIDFDFSEQYIADTGNNPQLQAITDRLVLINRNIVVDGNECRGMFPLLIQNGQGISFTNNKLAKNNSATGVATIEWVPYSIYDGATYMDRFFAESRNHWLCGLKFKNNTIDKGMPKDVTVDNTTEIFTATTNHEFVTGDRIEFYVGGNQTTVNMPGGLNYWTEYFAIKVTATTFKIATSYANALAGTAVNITSNGLTVAGEKLYAGKAVPQPVLSWNNSYIDSNADCEFEENCPQSQNVLFSTTSTITPGNNVRYKNFKVEHIANPLVDYATGNPKSNYGKYLPMPDKVTSNGVNTAGVERTLQVANAIGITKGSILGRWSGMTTDGYMRVSFW